MKKQYLILALLSVVILGACSSYKPPQEYKVVKQMEFDLPFDVVWSRLISKFAEIDMPFKNIDKSSGLLTTEKIATGNQSLSFMDCGTPAESFGASYQFENMSMKVNIVVTKIDENKTNVKVTGVFDAIYACYVRRNYQWVKTDQVSINCNSVGNIEKIVFGICSSKDS